MKCDICHMLEATVHLTEVVNNQVAKLHLCEKCAKMKGEEMQSHFGLTDLIASLMDFAPPADDEISRKETTAKCATCGMTYYDFQKTGKLGCEQCYDAFREDLNTLLRKIHGANRHVGQMPHEDKKVKEGKDTVERLQKELDRLVQDEEFEKAAILRDRIREIDKNAKTEEGS